MTSLSDTLTVGLVLVLLFGSIALYLYTRITQAEQKIGLLESILLEIKMSNEVKSYSELPAFDSHANSYSTTHMVHENAMKDVTEEELSTEEYVPFDEHSGEHGALTSDVHVAEDNADTNAQQYKSVIAEAINSDKIGSVEDVKTSLNNYETMTIKELQALAKSRGITGTTSMKKGPLIEALKTSDRVLSSHTTNELESGSLGTSADSFIGTSSVLGDLSSQ